MAGPDCLGGLREVVRQEAAWPQGSGIGLGLTWLAQIALVASGKWSVRKPPGVRGQGSGLLLTRLSQMALVASGKWSHAVRAGGCVFAASGWILADCEAALVALAEALQDHADTQCAQHSASSCHTKKKCMTAVAGECHPNYKVECASTTVLSCLNLLMCLLCQQQALGPHRRSHGQMSQ